MKNYKKSIRIVLQLFFESLISFNFGYLIGSNNFSHSYLAEINFEISDIYDSLKITIFNLIFIIGVFLHINIMKILFKDGFSYRENKIYIYLAIFILLTIAIQITLGYKKTL